MLIVVRTHLMLLHQAVNGAAPAADAQRAGCRGTSTEPPLAGGPAVEAARWLTERMVAPIPEPDPSIDPTEPVPDDPGELLPDAPEPLPPPPIEPTPDDPGGDPGGVPEPA